jgi:hypothetical protein
MAEILSGQQPVLTKQLEDMLESIKPVIIQSCRDDRWSVDLLGCMDQLSVTDDPHKCNHLFTKDQAVGLARRFMAVMMPKSDERAR